jgi:hypothetical protein
MSIRGTALLVVVVAMAAMAGCQAQEQQRVAFTGGHGEFLFGAVPLPLGQEDLGCFAVKPPEDSAQNTFDHEIVYVRVRSYDTEDNRASGLSRHRTETHTERRWLSYR